MQGGILEILPLNAIPQVIRNFFEKLASFCYEKCVQTAKTKKLSFNRVAKRFGPL